MLPKIEIPKKFRHPQQLWAPTNENVEASYKSTDLNFHTKPLDVENVNLFDTIWQTKRFKHTVKKNANLMGQYKMCATLFQI